MSFLIYNCSKLNICNKLIKSSISLVNMKKKNAYKYEELIDCALTENYLDQEMQNSPSPPMLMFNRIINIQNQKGKFNKGLIEAELDIKEKMWFFDCHFKEDPVMPGCLGLDAMWQLVGFFLRMDRRAW